MIAALPDVAAVWSWLAEVPDPEIPVVSVVDLGIVREVAIEGAVLVVTITPTYSGCPATAAIAREIEAMLHGRGIERCTLRTQIAPPWTTAWITAGGRAKLHAYGIAPPVAGAVACPRCDSTATTLLSQFAATPCKALYRCDDCREPFDRFKCH